MRTKHIALSPIYSTDSNLINQATYSRDLKSLRCIKWNVPFNERKNIVGVYGEDFFTTHVAHQCGFHLSNVEGNWLARVPNKYLKRTVVHQRLKDVSINESFIKPVDTKYFKAGVYETKEAINGYHSLDKDQYVYTSNVVEWDCEVRTFVLNNTIQTYSTYLKNGRYFIDSNIPKDKDGFEKFTSAFLNDSDVKLPEAIVVDFGYIKDLGWAIIEANPVYSSGIYACDPEKVLDVIIKSCEN
ncbi:ATP-grasp domain-containing protein [uncultured Psychroserpens sp.]|uniref:ATP-grasp domain-containing protein n=1 Tax=uncultured Psychroserpens sp. TaxID=255436 RepID=UPI002602AF97|nr:ATP-grasp domain-containing protein [uncultured Psychroserpens sp.]